MRRVAVLNVVGLSASLLPHAPRLSRHAAEHAVARLSPVLPAVTCSVQASMVTGRGVHEHGIVGNGWYDRDTCEVRFWQRSNRLVRGEKLWEPIQRAGGTCANVFWWYNSYSSCDWVIQARPIYKADGRKLPDCYTHPGDLRGQLQRNLGVFPLFRFWGPLADITSTRWIADAALGIERDHRPTLSLVYLPHLDYGLQKLGPGHPDIPRHVAEVDAVVGKMLDTYADAGVTPMILSEYGLEQTRPGGVVFINRVLREAGLLAVRDEDGLEMLDPGACGAFAVADHQVAHVYVRDASEREAVRRVCAQTPGVAAVTTIAHERAGDLVLVAEEGCWFTYDYWLDDAAAPDFARTVDIHRKPGYDPRELFSDKSPTAVAWKLARRKLGFRQLLDVVPLDASLVMGTHGRAEMPEPLQPLLIAPGEAIGGRASIDCRQVRDVVLAAVGCGSSESRP
jgi:predicted AlkP superfamily pyrophosphatase or phosphodiesterase